MVISTTKLPQTSKPQLKPESFVNATTKAQTLKKVKQSFTQLLIASLQCPYGKSQAFYWDKDTPNLGLRITASGTKSFIFEASLNNNTIRMTLGNINHCTIKDVRERAQRLKLLVNQGIDPRKLVNKKIAKFVSTNQFEANHQSITFKQAWLDYIDARVNNPHKQKAWSAQKAKKYVNLIDLNDQKRKNTNKTIGLLAPLSTLKLFEINGQSILDCTLLAHQADPHFAKFATKALRAFLIWCTKHHIYGKYIHKHTVKNATESITFNVAYSPASYLTTNQLPKWQAAIEEIESSSAKAYLQALLLTGRALDEVAHLTWAQLDIDHQLIKLQASEAIPLPPQLANILTALPQTSDYVFSENPSQFINEVSVLHQRACRSVNLNLTLNSLRKSFTVFADLIDMPLGVTAKIQNLQIKGIHNEALSDRPMTMLQTWHNKLAFFIASQS